MATYATVVFLACLAMAGASPVEKVIELMGECKAKIQKDVAAEQAAMEQYMIFCNDEVVERSYAIKSSERDIEDLSATIAEHEALVAEASQKMVDLGESIAAKGKELEGATEERDAQYEDFKAADAALVTAVDETTAAVAQLEKGMALAQGAQSVSLEQVKTILQRVIETTAIVVGGSRENLESLLQSSSGTGESDELTTNFKAALRQPAPAAYESQSGGILETVKGMQDKAEAQLSDLRKKELANKNAFTLLEDSLNTEIAQQQKSLAQASALKASSTEKLSTAQGELVATQKTKADDEEYSATMKQDCQKKAMEFEERTISVKAELAAIAKATEILTNGVVALVQSGVVRRSVENDDRRLRVATTLRNLGRKYHRMAFVELASAAASDPFVKIRGLIEDMIAKLLQEAAEEASHKAFCDQEMGKSNKAKAQKTQTQEKHQTSMDQESSEIAQLTEAVKRLQAEIGEIDKAQSEATTLRTHEKAENTQEMADLQQSADAVVSAITTLKDFYEGTSLVQISTRSRRAGQPEFGGAKSDSANGIIGILEVAESDFTKLYAETEAAEGAAEASYKKLTQENKITRAQKDIEAKGKTSQIKELEVALTRSTEDHAAVSSELEAVEAYLDKLKPECETKVMSYGEKKAAREAEIEGLKEALEILQGN